MTVSAICRAYCLVCWVPGRVPQDCAVWLVSAAGRGFRELLQPPDEDYQEAHHCGAMAGTPLGSVGLHGQVPEGTELFLAGTEEVWMRDGARLPRGWTTLPLSLRPLV